MSKKFSAEENKKRVELIAKYAEYALQNAIESAKDSGEASELIRFCEDRLGYDFAETMAEQGFDDYKD